MQSKQSQPTIKDFVLQQAYQKGFERLVMGLKQYEKQKKKIVGQKKEVLREQFDRRVKESSAQTKINKSTKINQSRMKKMNLRHQFIQQLLLAAQKRLVSQICSNQQSYKNVLKSLILQGLIKLFQPIVYVRCLKKDRSLVQSVLPQCKQQFLKLVKQAGIEEQVGDVDLRLDSRYSLQEKSSSNQRLKKSQESIKCFGGVLLTNEDGLIVCKNTLDARLQLSYQQLLPFIRNALYGDD